MGNCDMKISNMKKQWAAGKPNIDCSHILENSLGTAFYSFIKHCSFCFHGKLVLFVCILISEKMSFFFWENTGFSKRLSLSSGTPQIFLTKNGDSKIAPNFKQRASVQKDLINYTALYYILPFSSFTRIYAPKGEDPLCHLLLGYEYMDTWHLIVFINTTARPPTQRASPPISSKTNH